MILKEKINGITGFVRCILTDTVTGKQTIKEYHNIFTTVGKEAIARRLAGIGLKANEGLITYGSTGTGTDVPAVTDTKLQTELERAVVASTSYTGATCTIRTFFTTAESNGDLKEYGLFGEDATAAADSGTLFNRVAIDITKDVLKTLTIEVIFTIN